MEFIIKLKEYLQINREWIFSGIGVSIIIGLFLTIKKIFNFDKKDIKKIEVEINNLIGYEKIDIYDPRADFEDYFSYVVNQANKKIDAVSITFGFVSYVKLEKLIEERNIIFNFYILASNSNYYKKRLRDINQNDEIEDKDYLFKKNIERLKNLQKKFPNKVYLHAYNNYPYWHYILIDDNKIFLSYHPIGSLGYKVSNVFKINKKFSPKNFNLFFNHIKIIKQESKKL